MRNPTVALLLFLVLIGSAAYGQSGSRNTGRYNRARVSLGRHATYSMSAFIDGASR